MVGAFVSLVLLCAASTERETAAVDITGVNRALVFAELYKNARCSRMWHHPRKKITAEEAKTFIGGHVGEIYGVKMNVRVPSEDEESKLDARAYNEANGDGLAERVIENLKRNVGSENAYGNIQSCTDVRCTHFDSENCEFCCKACAICVGATVGGAVVCAGCGACCGAMVGACTSPYVGAALGSCIGCGVCACACCHMDICTNCVGMGIGATYGAVIGATLGPAAVAAAGAVAAGAGIGACVGAAAGSGAGACASVIMANRRNNKEGNPQEDSRMHETASPSAANPSQDAESVALVQRRVWKETRV